MVINRIGPLSSAKIVGALYAILGLVFGALFSIVALVGGFAGEHPGGTAVGALFGVAAIVVLPILYGCIGFVGALIMASLYNVIADRVGGVEVDIR